MQTITQEEFTAIASVIPPSQAHAIPYLGKVAPELRFEALKALANMAGLRLPNTILPEGTALLPVGEENKRKMQGDLAKLPDLKIGLAAYDMRLMAEDPKDVKVPLQLVRMGATTGGLYGEGNTAGDPIGYTRDGFSHIAQFLKPQAIRNGFSENILALPNGLRAEVFNHWAKNSPRKEDAILRTFDGGKGRIIRAVTSTSHSLETGDDRIIIPALQRLTPGAKVRITREAGGRLSTIEVIWPMMNRQLVVGDIAYGGVRITNSETKAAALRVEAFVLRVLCYNFTTAFSEDWEDETLSLKHVGDLSRRLPAIVQKAVDRINPLVQAFGDAYDDTFPDAFQTRGEVLQRAGKRFLLPESTLETAARLWDADGLKSAGDSRAGFVHALTRASQELDIETAAVVERAAGKVIMDGWDALR